ncbi:hypothetical protein ACFLR1_01565 [Bacteroidota bacterium]
MRHLINIVLFLFAVVPVLAQEQYGYPFNHGNYAAFEGMLNVSGSDFHTAVKPYRVKQLNESIPFDSIQRINYHTKKFSRTLFGRKLVRHSFLRLDSAKYQIFADPVMNFELGFDVFSKEKLTVNTKGFTVRGSIGRKVSFVTSFWENQASFMPYISSWIDRNQVVPGQGRVKDFLFDNGFYTALKMKVKGYDFSMANGYVSYSPVKAVNIQLGVDRLFIGDGYRSLLLSDVGYNYPFLKISTKIWKIQYEHIFTQLQDPRIPVPFESGYRKKWASFHYLSIAIGKRMQVGLFEGVIFKGDSTGTAKFNWNYFNPITLSRSIQYAYDGSGNNALVGINVKFIPFNQAAFYGQLAIDELNFNKLGKGGHIDQRLGWQLGFKVFNMFKLNGLYAQIEYNAARPYMYSNTSSLNSYTHYNQPLAHPLGANFHEVVGILGYKWKDLSFEYKATYAVIGKDSVGRFYGNDIYVSDVNAINGANSYGNKLGQGVKTSLAFQHLQIAYTVNRASHLSLVLGLTHRYEKSEIKTEQNLYLFFGIRTILRNLYYDF